MLSPSSLDADQTLFQPVDILTVLAPFRFPSFPSYSLSSPPFLSLLSFPSPLLPSPSPFVPSFPLFPHLSYPIIPSALLTFLSPPTPSSHSSSFAFLFSPLTSSYSFNAYLKFVTRAHPACSSATGGCCLHFLVVYRHMLHDLWTTWSAGLRAGLFVGQRSGPMNTRAKSSGGTVNVTLVSLTLDHY